MGEQALGANADLLGAWVPGLVRRAWAARGEPPAGPTSLPFQAAVLFVDVAGFTRLTELHAARGAAGVEAASRMMEGCFGRITEIAMGLGGDVMFFAGDGALVAWTADRRDVLGEATAAAAQAGLAIQGAMRAAEPVLGHRVSVRASIAAGECALVQLGGVDSRWECLLTGDPLRQIAQTHLMAEPGQVLLSPPARAAAADRCAGVPVAGGRLAVEHVSARPPMQPPSLASAPSWMARVLHAAVPRAVADRLAAGQGAWLAEFRDVTVLFVGLREVVGGGDPAQRLQAPVEALQSVMQRLEGTSYQFLEDEKGTGFVGVFGLPPLAHEDDAVRAVKAALAIRESLGRLGLPPAVGIATGRTFCGAYGTTARRQYAIVGPAMNLAARLMGATEGILCDEATRSAALRAWPGLAFDSVGPLRVKGRDEPVLAWAPSGERRAAASTPDLGPLLGRESECERLTAAVGHLQQTGSGGPVLIEGEAGIGKSRLAAFAVRAAQDAGFRVLAGGGDALEPGAGYHAWRGILDAVLGVSPGTDPVSRRAAVAACLSARPQLAERAPLLTAVFPALSLPETVTTAGMAGEARAENTRSFLLDLMQDPADARPTLLLMEDAHWLDSASWALAAHAARRDAILLVLTTRPATAREPAYEELGEHPGVTRLMVGPLAPAEVARLVTRCLGVHAVPEEIADLVQSTTAGNPFFAEQLVCALRDLDAIRVDDGRCVVTAPGGDPQRALRSALAERGLPSTIQGVLTSRLDRLPPDLQLTLKVGSVIGLQVSMEGLRAIRPVPASEDTLLAELRELEQRGLVVADPAQPTASFTFRHAITRDAAYGALPFAQRRALHASAARWYEAAPEGERPRHYAMLAHHWRGAEDVSRARHYLALAGEQALRAYANVEAAGFLVEALGFAAAAVPLERAERARLELQAGRAYLGLSDYAADRVHLEAGLALLGAPIPVTPPRMAAAVVREVLVQILHRCWPRRFVGRARARREVLLAQAGAIESLVETYFYLGDSLRSLYAALRTLNLAEVAGFSSELARGYAIVGAISGFIPAPRLARAYGRRAIEVVRRTNDAPARLWVSIVVGVSYAGLGAWSEAATLFEEAIGVGEGLRDRRRLDDATGNLALVELFCGDVAGAVRRLGATYASAVEARDRRYQAVAVRPLAYGLILLGRLDEAEQRLHELRAILQRGLAAEVDPSRQDLHGFSALLALLRGDRAQARAEAELALPFIIRADPGTAFFGAYLSAAAVADILLCVPGPRGRADARMARRAVARHARVFTIAQPAALWCAGAAAWVEGRSGTARRAWRRSAAAATRLGQPLDRALADAALGLHVRGHRLGDPELLLGLLNARSHPRGDAR